MSWRNRSKPYRPKHMTLRASKASPSGYEFFCKNHDRWEPLPVDHFKQEANKEREDVR